MTIDDTELDAGLGVSGHVIEAYGRDGYVRLRSVLNPDSLARYARRSPA